MIKIVPKILLGFLFFIFSFSSYSQGSGCPELGLDPIQVSCLNEFSTLEATFVDMGATTSYAVSSIPYDPPYPFTGGSGSTTITQDDRWSQVIDLGFDFCFFGDPYNKALISSNGAITFSIDGEVPNGRYEPNSSAGYAIRGTVPGNDGTFSGISSDARAVLGIFGVLQDTYPPNSFPGWSINYEIIGDTPCRSLVFNIYKLGQFSCGTDVGEQTYQIVLNEATNVIDVYVKDRTPCNGWRNGDGVIGIQNADASLGYTPPGRNTGNWSAQEEAWRFTPNGASVVTIDWLDENDVVIGTGTSITVRTIDIVDYKVRATYETCGANPPLILQEPVIIEFSGSFNLGDDIETCSDDDIILDADPGVVTGLIYEWSLDGNLIPGANQSTYTITAPNSGLYSVWVTFPGGCAEEDSIDIFFKAPPVVNDNPDPLIACDSDNDGFTEFMLSVANMDITMGNTALNISYHRTFLDAQTNEGAITDPYENRNPYNDVVFARVEDPLDGCYTIVELPLIVRDSPRLTMPTPLRICDDNTDGFQIFDLRLKESEMLGTVDPLLYDFYYYEDELEAIAAGQLALTNPNFPTTIPPIGRPDIYQNTTPFQQTVYVLVVGSDINTGEEGCFEVLPLQLIVDPLPIAIEPDNYHLCDDTINGSLPNDQISTFDLTSRNLEITGGNTDVTVTWYETLADELADIAIPNPEAYQNRAIPPAPVNPQTVVARVTNDFECSAIVTLTLVVDPLPPAINPTPLEVCDDNNDGFAEFDLTLKDDEIIGGEPDLIVKYYPLEALAQAGGAGEITGPYLNGIPFMDTVWVRLENTTTGCFSILELTLIVNPLPDVPTSEFGDLYECDIDGNGSAEFDLTLNTPFVFGSQAAVDFTLTFHLTLQEAQDDVGAILTPTAFPSPGQTIWARLENNKTLCARISEFDLIVGEFPLIQDPLDMEVCDNLESGSDTDRISTFNLTLNNAFITNGDSSLTVKYFETLADLQADNPITDPTTYTNPVDAGGLGITPYTIYVSVTGPRGCVATTELLLRVLPVPSAVAPTPLTECDDDNDGFAYFNLIDKSLEIAGGDPSIVVTYHETLIDANSGTFPLASPFQNIVAFNQTIYARASFDLPPNTSGCFKIVPLDLIVLPSPIVPLDLPDLVACDPDGNGFAEFNLTDQESLIYGNQDPLQLTLTYHLSQVDADTGDNPIGAPEAYTNLTNPQDIFVRLEFNDGSECYSTGQFALIVSRAVSIIDPTPFELCDDLDQRNDGFTTFDLTLKNSEITGGIAGMGVSYFLNEDDAQNNINKIDPDTAFVNTENPQTLYVRVIDGTTECIAYTTLKLRVLPNPEPVNPLPLQLCDENIVVGPGPDDNVEIFDLTRREAVILNGENWDVTYFESYEDAINEIGEIQDPENYPNTSNPQTIFVKVTNPGTSCFEIVKLQLIVNPLPDDTADVAPYIICELNTDGVAEFDLTSKVSEILGNQSVFNFEVSFYLDPVDAANGDRRIVNTTAHQNRDLAGNPESPQTIYTRIEDRGTGCAIGGNQSFELIVQEDVVINTPPPFIICDNLGPNDGIAEFDLEDFSNPDVVALRDYILVGQDPSIFLLTYYETIENAMNASNPLSFPYINVINPQVIYARVTNDDNEYEPKCFEVVEVILKVEELPRITLDDEYRLCVDEFGNPIPDEDGTSSPPLIDTGLSPSLYTFQWLLNGVLLPGETGPSIIALQGGEYTVIVTEIASGCDNSATTTVVVSSPPLVYSAEVVSSAFANTHIIEVTVEGDGDYVYQLDNGPFQSSNVFENVSPGVHTITIRDINGCGSVTIEVSVVDYPLYFTPNEDGYHDTWNIIAIGTADPMAKIYIFDRFGKLLKQLSPIGEGWDGTYNGNPMPSSDYWFRVEYTEKGDAKVFTGHFTLKR